MDDRLLAEKLHFEKLLERNLASLPCGNRREDLDRTQKQRLCYGRYGSILSTASDLQELELIDDLIAGFQTRTPFL